VDLRTEDAVDVEIRDTDKEAECSGYYREEGYRGDIDLGIPY